MHVRIGLDVLLKEQFVPLLYLVAFLNQDRGDSSKSLGGHIRIGRGLDLTRGRHQGHQAVLLGDLGRLHRNNALVGLIYAEKNNSAEYNHNTRANRHFMPRLHSLPFRSTTLRPPLQLAAIPRSSMKSWGCGAARWPMPNRSLLLVHTPVPPEMFRGTFN